MNRVVVRLLLLGLSVIIFSCGNTDVKDNQTIQFDYLAPHNISEGSIGLKAIASSNLPVLFVSSDSTIVTIEGNRATFLKAGVVKITAKQSGNEQYYEAPNVVRDLVIRSWDPNKKNQTISFDLTSERKISQGLVVELEATATSGLPIIFTSDNSKGQIYDNVLILYHGQYKYDVYINITASQGGNDMYNYADNVVRTIHVIGDETHK